MSFKRENKFLQDIFIQFMKPFHCSFFLDFINTSHNFFLDLMNATNLFVYLVSLDLEFMID